MRLYGWERVGSAEEYREMIRAEYVALKRRRSNGEATPGMEEVKLRLFLSLLERPGELSETESDCERLDNSSERPAAA
ncbi:MAG: hypothetical protein RL326_1280 [Pseudomonadota bacterium]|jgi:hypothetical protein